jgi:hypothetical protein
MSLEKWAAIASIGLFAMFVGEMITIYNFISIGIAPASILAALSFILSKRYGSKQIGSMILGGGIILLIGMTYCYTLLDNLIVSYLTDVVKITPPLFMGISIPVMTVGIFLIKTNKKRPKKEYF